MFSAFHRFLGATHIKAQQNLFPCFPGQDVICSIDRESTTHSMTDAFQLHKASSKCSCTSLLGAALGDLRCPATCVRGGITSAFQKPPWWEANQMRSILPCEIPRTKSLGKFSGPPSRITGFGQTGLGLVLCFGFCFLFPFLLHCVNIWAKSHWHTVLRCNWTINKY